MGPSVVTAVLLFVCILGTETASNGLQHICEGYQEIPCGDGWSRIDENYCAKYIWSRKTLHEAQQHCRTLNSDLVSINSAAKMTEVLCLTFRADPDCPSIWIGAATLQSRMMGLGAGGGIKLLYYGWFTPDENGYNQKKCIELNPRVFGYLNAAHCSEEKYFVCAKEMMITIS